MGGGGGMGGAGIVLFVGATGDSFLRSLLLIAAFVLIILLAVMEPLTRSLRLFLMFVCSVVILLLVMDWSHVFLLVVFIGFADWLYKPYFPSKEFFPEPTPTFS
ncbi:hypothetical protein B0H12DRAFT_1120857 [Mycena haematopus]|nr:hypothetical protein B0H12DRAFT_1120857 [Mycena haematopus]